MLGVLKWILIAVAGWVVVGTVVLLLAVIVYGIINVIRGWK